MRRETTLFTLVCRSTQTRHPVQIWKGYGVVAPTLWTTNGSAAYVAEHTPGYLRSGAYEVADSVLERGLDFTDRAVLLKSLRDAFETFSGR